MKAQTLGGDMIKVIVQALEKRLVDGLNRGRQQLSGAETSATMMASDFLLEYINQLDSAAHPLSPRQHQKGPLVDDSLDDDEFLPGPFSEDDESSVLFGGRGILKDDYNDFDVGYS